MVRAATRASSSVVANPARYAEIAVRSRRTLRRDKTRMELAQEAFAHTAAYDDMIQHYLAEQLKK